MVLIKHIRILYIYLSLSLPYLIEYKISYGVAGALLLSVAACSPELLISLYATFLTEGYIATDIIAGTSVFNFLAVPALCCIFIRIVCTNEVKYVLELIRDFCFFFFNFCLKDYCIDWWPISRDFLWHLVAILCLSIFIGDNFIRWWEALCLACLQYYYVGYLCMDAIIQNIARGKQRIRGILQF